MLKNQELVNKLSWNCSTEDQEKAIEELSKLPVDSIKYLIQPNGKEYWHNAAIVIKNIIERNKISHQEEEIISSLMEWTEDLNWPGTSTIIECLKILPQNLVEKMIQNSLRIAKENKDNCWIESLNEIIKDLDFTK